MDYNPKAYHLLYYLNSYTLIPDVFIPSKTSCQVMWATSGEVLRGDLIHRGTTFMYHRPSLSGRVQSMRLSTGQCIRFGDEHGHLTVLLGSAGLCSAVRFNNATHDVIIATLALAMTYT